MWGQIMTELSYQPNFNISFSNTKADVLIHLSQWQYWWWFWFNLVWVLYFFILIRILRFRILKFNPKISTSMRPHGKWGDLIICMLPLGWCINILINSNFLLKMVEWQNESNLFTLRIRGKQWYWVYKIDSKNLLESLSSKKNIGHNNWLLGDSKDFDESSRNISFLKLRLLDSWYKTYIKDLDSIFSKKNKQFNVFPIDKEQTKGYGKVLNFKMLRKDFSYLQLKKKLRNLKIVLLEVYKPKSSYFKKWNYIYSSYKSNQFMSRSFYFKKFKNSSTESLYSYFDTLLENKDIIIPETVNTKIIKSKLKNLNIIKINNKNLHIIKHNDYLINTREIHRPMGLKKQIRLLKLNFKVDSKGASNITENYKIFYEKHNIFFDFFNNSMTNTAFYKSSIFKNIIYENLSKQFVLKHKDWYSSIGSGILSDSLFRDELLNIKKDVWYLIKPRFNKNTNFVGVKDFPENLYYVLKQKRYSRKRIIQPTMTKKSFNTKEEFFKKPVFRGIKKLEDTTMNYTRQYRMIKKAKKRYGDIPVTLTKRLLKTNKILVLPAHVNITAVTNSYDVVHSWFVPGLGLKMDCIPGRSTHHTFYIDNVGFYYGQCAEICGRYHHHMPIKLCALPLNHFFLWWHSSALPKMMYSSKSKELALQYTSRKYLW